MIMSYEIGDIIIRCKPLAHTLNDNQKSNRCDYCFKQISSLQKCSNCKSMYYCNKLCQKNDWNECHKYECQINRHYYAIYDDCDRFLLRLWLMTSKSEHLLSEKMFELHNGMSRCLNQLMTHEQHIRDDQIRFKYFNKICDRFNVSSIAFDTDILFRLFCVICINSFSILNEDLNPIGTALYISASNFDHSCEPNAAPVFNGINLQIRAIKRIDSAQQVFINYIDSKAPKQRRQLNLRQQYYFECHCTRCDTECDKCIDYDTVNELNKELDDSIDTKDGWDKCYSLCLKSISFYTDIYGDFHPDLTVQLLRLLKLKVLITDDLKDECVIQLIRKVENSIRITHGFEHSLYELFQQILGLR